MDDLIQMYKINWPFGRPARHALIHYYPRELPDVNIVGPTDGKILTVHSRLMIIYSKVFQFIIRNTIRSKRDSMMTIHLNGTSIECIILIFNYIYTGEAEVPDYLMDDFRSALKVYNIRDFRLGDVPAIVTTSRIIHKNDVKIKPKWL